MNRKERIIKCLRHCNGGDCEDCKALGACDATWAFHKDALSLIKELAEENEKLRADNRHWISQVNCDAAEIKILREHWKVLATTIDKQENELKTIKADTVRKMQERFKVEVIRRYQDIAYRDLFFGVIDQIAKEMLEGGEKA